MTWTWPPQRAVRMARLLWIAQAIIVWNVVFDRMLVLAGRRYVYAAAVAADNGGPYLLIDDWMRPAVTRALWTASAVALAILAVSMTLIQIGAGRLGRPGRDPGNSPSPGLKSEVL